MTKTRTWGILAVVLVVVVVVAGWFLALSPQHAKVKKLHVTAAQQLDANQGLKNQILLLKQQQKQIPGEQARIAAIDSRIPATPAMTTYVRTLATLAAATHVELVSVSPSAPTPVQVAAAPGATAAPAPSPAAGASLSAIQLSIDVVGDYYAVQQFLSQLEATQRATVVSSIDMQPGQLPQGQAQASDPKSKTAALTGADWTTLDARIAASVFVSGNSAAAVSGASATAQAAAVPSHAAGTSPSAAPVPAASTPSAPAAANQ